MFGLPFDVTELARNIGLDADTNTNLTRRMLLLLESRERHGDVRSGAIVDILARYLNRVRLFWREGLSGGRDDAVGVA